MCGSGRRRYVRKTNFFTATFLHLVTIMLQNFNCILRFFAHATLLNADPGFQYILNITVGGIKNADPKFQDPHISGIRTLRFESAEIMSAQNFNFLFKFSLSGGSIPNCAVFDNKNLPTKNFRQFSDSPNFGGGVGQLLSCPPLRQRRH